MRTAAVSHVAGSAPTVSRKVTGPAGAAESKLAGITTTTITHIARATAPTASEKARRICPGDRIVRNVGVSIPGLRVGDVHRRHSSRVGCQPAALHGSVLTGRKVVETGFRIKFLAGVLRGGVKARSSGKAEPIAPGQAGVKLIEGAAQIGQGPRSPHPIDSQE